MLGWMLRKSPVLAVFYLADIVVPFVLVGSFASWTVSLITGARSDFYGSLPLPAAGWQALLFILGLTALMTTLSLSVRFGRHFAYRPTDLVHLPTFMLINTFVLMPIRVLGFFRMAHNAGWGTRAGGFAGERHRNPLLVVPYVLGGIMLTLSVMIGV
jgi:hyaluronan synthase